MTRGCSTAALKWQHIQSANDNFIFTIPKSKSDQEGVKLDPKHVFANVLNPYICPMYALAIYTMCLRNQHSTDVFPGGQQLSRFSKALNRHKHDNRRIRELLAAYGYTPEDVGVHSSRKGAGSCACNGIVGQTPSISAVCLRAGWTQGAIKDKYLKYEHAQDTYLGRVLAGYPVTGPDVTKFGSLPPTWGRNVLDERVKHALTIAFPCILKDGFPPESKGLFNSMLADVAGRC